METINMTSNRTPSETQDESLWRAAEIQSISSQPPKISREHTIIQEMDKKILNKDEIDVVLYHGSCSDGFGTAFIVWYYYKYLYGMDRVKMINFIPCYYLKDNQLSNNFIEKILGKNVLMCDFSYKYDQLLQIISSSKSFMILDHHKTAEEDLKQIPECYKIFDMNRSGCGITWDFFYANLPIPKFLAYIQDRDIWAKKLSETSLFVAYFYEQDFDFDLWEKYLDEEMVKEAINKGTIWLEYQNVLIDKIIKKTSYIIQEINNKYAIVLYCNCPKLKSDIGNKVFNKFPFGDFSCIWDYNLFRDQSYYSLVSTNDRMDVSQIALKFGGGGHRNASGIVFAGKVGCLPFKCIDDPGILSLLLYKTKGTFKFQNKCQSYTLFKVNEIKNEWLQEEYFDLIKRKCSDTPFIVFEKPSDAVDFIFDKTNDTTNKLTGEIVPLKEYSVFFNEVSCQDHVSRLKLMVCSSKEHVLTFNSSKEFCDIFSDHLSGETSYINEYFDNSNND